MLKHATHFICLLCFLFNYWLLWLNLGHLKPWKPLKNLQENEEIQSHQWFNWMKKIKYAQELSLKYFFFNRVFPQRVTTLPRQSRWKKTRRCAASSLRRSKNSSCCSAKRWRWSSSRWGGKSRSLRKLWLKRYVTCP